MSLKDQRVRLRKDVWDSLQYYMHDEKARLAGIPGVMPDSACVVNEILMNYLAAKGHFPPRAPTALAAPEETVSATIVESAVATVGGNGITTDRFMARSHNPEHGDPL